MSINHEHAGQRVYFHPDYLEPVRSGAKRATIRYRDPVDPGPADLVFQTDPEVVLAGEVTDVSPKRLAEVTDEEAVAAGNRDHADLLARLPRHYPEITADDEVTIVRFRVLPQRA
ncbi:ASCH domain-containing protein [Streptomyces sp. NPDC001480]|uniref:ASCH domain-containing protein n=1 Tax=Streptomyces sp. NPDC001480 TaxID=3364577 RepID=UPI003696CC0E